MPGFTHADSVANQGDGTAVTSIAGTLTKPVGAGDLVCAYSNNPTASSITFSDSAGIGTWVLMGSPTDYSRAAYCIATVAAPGGTTVTASGSGSTNRMSIVADRFTAPGVISYGSVAVSAAAAGTSGNLGSLASVPAGALLWGAMHTDTTGGVVFTAGSSNGAGAVIGSQATYGSDGSVFSEYILSAAGGTESVTWTASAAVSGLVGWEAYFTSAGAVSPSGLLLAGII